MIQKYSNYFSSLLVHIAIFALLCPVFVIAQNSDDLRTALQWMYENAKEQWNLHDLPKWLIQGDIYSRSYKISERNMSKSHLDAITATYDYLKNTCDGDINISQVTQVFQNTPIWRELLAFLERKDLLASLDDEYFADACVQVFLCANKNTKLTTQDRKRLYTLNTYEQCQRIVQSIHQDIAIRSENFLALEDTNYGDDLFANRKEDDAPYDLLYDIEAIGNILYTHNDPATEIQFYDLRPLTSYQRNEPLTAEHLEDSIPQPTSENPIAHLPPTNGVTPAVPDLSYLQELNTRNQQFKPSDSQSAQGRWDQWFPTPLPFWNENIDLSSPQNDDWWLLWNNICIAPNQPEKEERDLLKDAQDLQKETYDYNSWLNLKDRIALDILQWILPASEEEKPVYERNPNSENDLGALVSDELDVDNDDQSLSTTENSLKKCLEESKLETNQWRKDIRKKAGESIKLSQCVQNVLCKGVHDPSNQWMFTIKFCKIPSKRYNVVANMPIDSIEDVILEMRNICINLKDSGQLIKHQQTKDGIFTSQLPKLNLKNMFNFEIAFTTKPTWAEKDVRTEKIEQEQQHQYLEKTILNITEQLTHEEQRNKYILIANPYVAKANTELQGVLELEQNRINKAQKFYESLKVSDTTKQNVLAQKKLMATTQDSYEQFIEQQKMFRDGIHGHITDINKKRKEAYDRFQGSKK